ncbi:hypothetical protein CH361_03885 [Leptospira brenneri]|nr:hypothetical protein CH361_03885 [Leptospira brenneri]
MKVGCFGELVSKEIQWIWKVSFQRNGVKKVSGLIFRPAWRKIVSVKGKSVTFYTGFREKVPLLRKPLTKVSDFPNRVRFQIMRLYFVRDWI